MNLKLILFILLSCGIVCRSWPSLKNPKEHGFYRFFVFELTAVIVFLNVDYWFVDPLSIRQVISWSLLLLSLYFVLAGFILLRKHGRSKEGKFENTTVLVTRGIYNRIRHPLYSSLIFLSAGAFFKRPTLIAALITISAALFAFFTAKVEEAECIKKFGAKYSEWMKTTRMFVPFLF